MFICTAVHQGNTTSVVLAPVDYECCLVEPTAPPAQSPCEELRLCVECQAFQSGVLAEVAIFLLVPLFSSSLPLRPISPPLHLPSCSSCCTSLLLCTSLPRTVLLPAPPSPWTTGRLAWAGASSRCCSQLVESLSTLRQLGFRVKQVPQDGSPCTATNTGGCSYSYSYRLNVTSAGTILPSSLPQCPQ